MTTSCLSFYPSGNKHFSRETTIHQFEKTLILKIDVQTFYDDNESNDISYKEFNHLKMMFDKDNFLKSLVHHSTRRGYKDGINVETEIDQFEQTFSKFILKKEKRFLIQNEIKSTETEKYYPSGAIQSRKIVTTTSKDNKVEYYCLEKFEDNDLDIMKYI